MSQAETKGRCNPQAWHYLNRFMMIVILLVASAFGVFTFYPAWNRRDELAAKLESEQARLAAEQLLQKQRAREVTLLQTDPEYVEMIARDKLGVMKPGETIYRLDGSKNPASARQPAPTPSPEKH